jgi:FG-GAP-like repeat/IPT/TIG domain/Secretion system C-terminal sorting domain
MNRILLLSIFFILTICKAALCLAPTISSFSPTSGPIGTLVKIFGANFSTVSANNIVYFGATKATVTAATATQLTVTVPKGATYQPITVTVGGFTAFSNSPFIVTFTGGGAINVNSFLPKIDFTTGNQPYISAIGDLNSDGKPDIVVANYNSNTISVLRNTSVSGSITTSSFAAKVDFTTGTSPYSTVIGDIDGDGKPDLVVTNYVSNTVSIFRNTSVSGSITVSSFAAKLDFTTGAGPYSVSIGDIDLDGKPDLAIANLNANTVSVLRNTSVSGSINVNSFASKVDFATGTGPYSIAIGDIDVDGKPDLTVANLSANTVSVLRNTSVSGSITSSSFAIKVDFATGLNPCSSAIGDVDGDSKPDLVVANQGSNSLSVFLNTSVSGSITASSFAAQVNFATGTKPFSATIGDIDGDGKVDLVVANGTSGTISVLRNTSVAGYITVSSFASKVDFATGAVVYPAIGDVDGDSKPDIVFANYTFTTVSILFNDTGAPAPVPIITSFSPASGIIGTSVTIRGTNFNSIPANNIVKFNGSTATVTSSTVTSITTVVPVGAVTGPITVTVGTQTGTSASNFVVVSPVQITSSNFPVLYDYGGALSLSITVDDATKVNTVSLNSRGISQLPSALTSTPITASGNTYSITLPPSSLVDPIGLSYYFSVTDNFKNVITSTITSAYVHYPANSTAQVIPALTFGDQVSSYQIISVPLALKNNSVLSVFSALGKYNIKQWRLFGYASGDNQEFPSLSAVDVGKGYWFIARNSTVIDPGEGTTVNVDDKTPFIINLSPGWNLIGNPYNFRLSWTDIFTFNNSPPSLSGGFTVFNNGTLSQSDLLDKYRGAFIFNGDISNFPLKISAIRNSALGGRMESVSSSHFNSIDQDHWEINLSLTNGESSNRLGGVGMDPQATLKGKDAFDEVSVPLPDGFDIPEIVFPHPELHAIFNKEIVPTNENYTWDFSVRKYSQLGNIEISWANNYFGESDKQLFLFDPFSFQIVDMRKTTKYGLNSQAANLKIIYGSAEYVKGIVDEAFPLLGNPYPNPATTEVWITFKVTKSMENNPIGIKIFNYQGMEVENLIAGYYTKGVHEAKWNPDVSQGLYFIRLNGGGQDLGTVKVVIHK